MAASKKKKKRRKEKNSAAKASSLYHSLTKVRFEYQDKVYELDLGSELLVDNEDLHSQVERIPAVMGYLGSIISLLNKEFKNKEALKKKIEAKLDKAVRNKGVIGEQRIDKYVKRHPAWVEACVKVNEAREKVQRIKFLYNAVKEKSIVLISRSSDIRAVPSDSIRGVSSEEVILFDDEEIEVVDLE